MKGKMFIILAVMLVISYFLYQHGNKASQQPDDPSRYITGAVTDSQGSPISKATVYLLGADTKVGTDGNGEYKIKAVVGDELIITHPMYKKRAIEIKSKSENVTLLLLNEKDELKDKIKEDFPEMDIQ